MSRLLLVANPIAGRGRAKSSLPAIEGAFRREGFRVETLFSTPEGPGDLMAAVKNHVETVVSVGGDGTLNGVVRSLLSSAPSRTASELPAVGIIPMGTGNASIEAFGIPRRIADAVEVVVRGKHREMDVGIVTRGEESREVFLFWLGAGVDGMVMHTISRSRSGALGVQGIVARAPLALRNFLRYPFHEITVEVDDRPPFICNSALIANVGSVPLLGRITSHSNPCDGVMEILTTSEIRFMAWVRIVAAVWRRRPDSLPGVTRLRGSRFKLSTGGRVPVQIDGDASGFLSVEVNVKPRALRLLLPGSAGVPPADNGRTGNPA